MTAPILARLKRLAADRALNSAVPVALCTAAELTALVEVAVAAAAFDDSYSRAEDGAALASRIGGLRHALARLTALSRDGEG